MNRAHSVVRFATSLILVVAAFPLLFGANSCSRISEIVLVVDTDMVVPTELDLIDVSITGPSGPASPVPSIDLNQPGAPSFPLTLGLLDKGTSSMITVTVTGRHRDATTQTMMDVAGAEVRTRFVDGQKLMLPVFLSAACLGKMCPDVGATPQICKLGTCVSLVLRNWTGKIPQTDQSPTPVGGRSLWSTGWRSCATKGEGLYCWGQNINGELGNGVAAAPSLTRVLVTGLPDGPLKSIGLGYHHSCVCDFLGRAWCWGLNDSGQVTGGVPTAAPQLTPFLVPGVTECTQIAAGWSHTCAVVGTSVSCWGANDNGQAGQPLTMTTTSPKVVAGVSAVYQVQAGENFTCALSTMNAVYCWGDSRLGQLGDTSPTRSFTPKRVVGLSDRPSDLALGRNFACVIIGMGQVACWGENSDTMIGTGAAPSAPPTMISGVIDASQIAAGHQHVCVLRRTGGRVSCWGNGVFGQLGGGDNNTSAVPIDVVDTGATNPLGAMNSIAVGDQHSCARGANGSVYCWGQDTLGQLGDNSTGNSNRPVEVVGF